MRLAVIWVGELLCRSMSDPKSENDCELQIDPELLAKMHAHCRRIEAELEAQADRERYSAEHFAAAVSEMPEGARRFFEHEEPTPPWCQESDEDCAERERLAVLGGWAGG